MKVRRKSLERILGIVNAVLIVGIVLAALHYGRRALVCDRFVVHGHSMEPTFTDGQRIWVNKLLMGPRIYRKYDFDSPELSCFRLPGFRKLRVGDIVVFNYPWGWQEGVIGFKINYVYAKRCAAVAGDTLRILDGRIINSRTADVGQPAGTEQRLRATSDSLLLNNLCLRAGQFAGKEDRWTIRNMGPVVVPAECMTVEMNPETAADYALVIRYETGHSPLAEADGAVTLNGEPLAGYTFRKNYFFFVGDNAVDSKDSRYIGFVPEEFAIGIVGGRASAKQRPMLGRKNKNMYF